MLTEAELERDVSLVIDSALSAQADRDGERFTAMLTVGQFKGLVGFQGSVGVMRHLVDSFIGRLMRAATRRGLLSVTKAFRMMVESTSVSEAVAEALVRRYTGKLGPARGEDIARLDQLASAWEEECQRLMAMTLAGDRPPA